MPKVTYSRWKGVDWDSISLEELLNRMSDRILNSGYDGYFDPDSMAGELDLESLYQELLRALMDQGFLSPEDMARMMSQDGTPSEELHGILERLVQRMVREGYLKEAPTQQRRRGGNATTEDIRFDVTDKTIDFLGFRTLKELLGPLGKSSFGRHETRYLSTGTEAHEAPKPYEFGDTLNLDTSETLLASVARAGLRFPLELEYPDLRVRQAEYHSSCATALLLDTSHSMILYGEDRFTPAKRVALALAHLIRTQFPGDSLHLILFHDSAEEIPLKKLAGVKVGPYYTNTREGLRLARSVLSRQRKDMRQIIMITDGKPSAITLPGGRIYRNPMGLDPMILGETFREVGYCRRSGIMINTFMLARDYYLIEFVRKVAQICRGKAYFATTLNLGQYILMDYMKNKRQTVH